MSQEQELASFWGFISRSIERIIACMDGLSAEELNWRPGERANSLYVLGTHILGTTEENILGVLCGQPTSRQREAEFAAMGASVEPLRIKWQEFQECIKVALDGLPPGELERERGHPRRGLLLGREVLVVVARHAAEHMGQAELTRDLLFASQGRIPPRREY